MTTGSTKTKARVITGYAALAKGKSLEPLQYELPPLGNWDLEIDVICSGLCHTDIHLLENDWGMSQYPLIPGHEVVGRVRDKGKRVENFEVGDLVGVGYLAQTCQTCEWCQKGDNHFCPKAIPTCIGRSGGFAEAIVADSRVAIKIPNGMKPEDAAPLLCAGATVYSPLAENNISGKKVGIIGVGGLGHLAIQFAHAMNAEVTVFSSSSAKEKDAKSLGADHFILSNNKRAMDKAEKSLDFILSTASEGVDFSAFLPLLRPEGKICILGAKGENIDIPSFPLLTGNLWVGGSHIASTKEIEEMFQFAAEKNIKPMIEIFDLPDINRAFKKLATGDIHYRAVIRISQ